MLEDYTDEELEGARLDTEFELLQDLNAATRQGMTEALKLILEEQERRRARA